MALAIYIGAAEHLGSKGVVLRSAKAPWKRVTVSGSRLMDILLAIIQYGSSIN